MKPFIKERIFFSSGLDLYKEIKGSIVTKLRDFINSQSFSFEKEGLWSSLYFPLREGI